ncbi:hypothetical protein GCM10009743_24620 [Kribbella swartbergensis]
MWLTATSYRRSQSIHPTPDKLTLPIPEDARDANRILSAGPIQDESGSIFWFVEAITSRESIAASMSAMEE